MRVLHIVDNLSRISGVMAIIMGLYRNVDRNAVQFDFFVMRPSKENYEDEITFMGGRIYHVSNPLSPSTCFQAMRESKAFFKKHAAEYNIVHSHTATTAFFNLRYARKYGIRNRIVHSHSSMFSPNIIIAIIDNLLCFGLKKYANRYFACSMDAGDFLYGKKHNAVIINNAINTSVFTYSEGKRNEIRHELHVGMNDLLILHVARFDAIKNQAFLLRTMEKVIRERTNVKVVFLGDGQLKQQCEELATSLGLRECATFLGFRKDVEHYLSAADLVVLPSLKEGLPLTVVEAQACGVPTLVADSITWEVNMGYVEYLPLIEDRWAEYICSFVPMQPEKRTQCARELIGSRFNIVHEAQRIKNIYQSYMAHNNIKEI